MTRDRLDVGIVGCGLVGRRRVAGLAGDRLVGVYDLDAAKASALGTEAGARVCASLDELAGLEPDVIIVATTHDALSETAQFALEAGAHVLVEKPGGRSVAEINAIQEAAERANRIARVGFNHRYYPGIARAVREALGGDHGEVMFLRARYGHGGRIGYEQEWRARAGISGGGELLDQGMHLLDLCYWVLGPLPLHSAFVRTSFWSMEVEDNAVVTLADTTHPTDAWATFHVSWSEWKNEFALEIYCRTAKLHVRGLAGSYGPQVLTVYRMRPEMGPPDAEDISYASSDPSWELEWLDVRDSIRRGATGSMLAGARYGLSIVEEAYRRELVRA